MLMWHKRKEVKPWVDWKEIEFPRMDAKKTKRSYIGKLANTV